MTSPPELIVKHDTRLDILCCLLDAGDLAVKQISAMLSKSEKQVSYHLSLLFSHELVDVEMDDAKDDEPRDEPTYRASLEKHDDWVWEAVQEHRNPPPPNHGNDQR